MNMKFNTSALLVAMSMAASGSAIALEPQGIKLADSMIFTPTLQVSERYDDNFRAVETGEEDSFITSLTPTFILGAKGNKSFYSVMYSVTSDTFHSSHSDNNTDQHATVDGGVEFNARNRLKLNAGYHKIEETASIDQSVENDKYSTYIAGGVFSYGAESARAQIDFGANVQKLQYHNSGTLNADKERDTTAFNVVGYMRVAPKTRLLLELRHTDYAYITNTVLDSQNVGVLGGVTWEATARTTGTVKVGGETKQFDDHNVSDKSNAMWEAGITWEPLTYSKFSLNTRSGLDEGSAGASVIKSNSSTLGWKHSWLERLSTDVSYTHSTQDYQSIVREDTINAAGLGLTYAMRRWLDVGAGYRYAETDSTFAGESDKRNIFSLSVSASL